MFDLTGDGLVTTALEDSSVHFDLNNNFFAERTGWLTGRNEGFLVFDQNANGAIDDSTEMFGTFTGSGFADLARYDDNHDGVINANDRVFNQLLMWIDANGDGVSTADELHRLAALDIASIALEAQSLDGQTAGGATVRAVGRYTRTDGTSGAVYETIFPTDQTDTIYRGESGQPSWAPARPSRLQGFPPARRRTLRTWKTLKYRGFPDVYEQLGTVWDWSMVPGLESYLDLKLLNK